jgi:hypothetical protein
VYRKRIAQSHIFSAWKTKCRALRVGVWCGTCLVGYLKTLPVGKIFGRVIRGGQIVGDGSAGLNIPCRPN